jgi:regulatory protein
MTFIPRKYSPELTAARVRLWCNKAERAHSDVRQKLIQWGVPYLEREALISELVQDNLLNEARYAEAFAVDHFRFRQWGVRKIVVHLKKKGVSERNIHDALKRIAPEEIRKTVLQLAQLKAPKLVGKTALHRKFKLMSYLLRKGFSAEDVRRAAEEVFGPEE